MERTDNLPEIMHLRAAPLGYNLTETDKELLRDTYLKLDDILKEVEAFIKIKFPGRTDHVQAWNKIDFDTKIGGLKVVTTDNEHIKRAWKGGLFDLKSLIKSLINEVNLLVDVDDTLEINSTQALEINDSIVNNGSLIINHSSKINKQSVSTDSEQKDSGWTKANVIIALIVGIATIVGILWQIFN